MEGKGLGYIGGRDGKTRRGWRRVRLFDDSVAGDARDPYPELAQARREHPVQKLDSSMMPHDEALPVFFVYRFDDIARVAGLRHLFVGSHHRHDHGPGHG